MIAIRPGPGKVGLMFAASFVLAACAVRLQAPEEPIRFDVNINITEEKRLEIDQELLALIRRNPELFGLRESDLPDPPSQLEEQP
jgi:hypothetical protein